MASSPTIRDASSQLIKCTLYQNHETSENTLNTLHLYGPNKISIVTSHETEILEKISPELTQQLNYVKGRVMASPQKLDVDSILHVHHASLQRQRQSYWHLIIITTVCITIIIGIICLCLRYLHRTILPCYSTRRLPNPHTDFKLSHPFPPHLTQKQTSHQQNHMVRLGKPLS